VQAGIGVAPGTLGMPDDPRPAITQEALGKGVVIRIGLPGWAGRLTSDASVVQLTGNAVDVLLRSAPQPREIRPPEPRHKHRKRARGRHRAKRG
jgi:hypothetical protein